MKRATLMRPSLSNASLSLVMLTNSDIYLWTVASGWNASVARTTQPIGGGGGGGGGDRRGGGGGGGGRAGGGGG